jgi:N-acylneuraminate cytidylyltransferase
MPSSSLVALVPARGGSKRVPGKNIRMLEGHPVLAYTISAALESGIFAGVVVSTDDERTASIARHYGAEVPALRPAELARDASPDIEWVEHALDELRRRGQEFVAFSILRPTSPFRQANSIRRAWHAFEARNEADSLRAVEKCRQHPGKMWVLDGDWIRPLLPNANHVRPWHSTPYQALPPVYVQNASLEIAWTRVVRETGTIAGERIVPFFTERHEGFDINDEYDWWLAEEIVRRREAALPVVRKQAYVS